jgi:probable DNA metabolism protein
MTIVYDGSYCGYLTAIAKGQSHAEIKEIITEDEAASILLGDLLYTAADSVEAENLSSYLHSVSKTAAYNILISYLSEISGFELASLKYLAAVMKYGRSADSRLAEPEILAMTKLTARVSSECHRMLGLIRFSETTGGVYYAPYEPDHNITSLIAGHFAARIPDTDWIIHDRYRNIAAVYRKNDHRYEVVSGDFAEEPGFTEQEIEYRKLWKRFFHSIPIPERKNPKQQKKCMPARYWKHLTEKN